MMAVITADWVADPELLRPYYDAGLAVLFAHPAPNRITVTLAEAPQEWLGWPMPALELGVAAHYVGIVAGRALVMGSGDQLEVTTRG